MKVKELVVSLRKIWEIYGDIPVCLNFREIEGIEVRRIEKNDKTYISLQDGDIEVINEGLFRKEIQEAKVILDSERYKGNEEVSRESKIVVDPMHYNKIFNRRK